MKTLGAGGRRSSDAMTHLKKIHSDAIGALALEEYSLLALKDEQAQLKELLHEVDEALPLTTRRSGLNQARPPPIERISEAAAAVAAQDEDQEADLASFLQNNRPHKVGVGDRRPVRRRAEDGELDLKMAAELEFKAETAARKLEMLSDTVAHCRHAALRSLAARLRQTEEQLALRKESPASTPMAAQKSTQW